MWVLFADGFGYLAYGTISGHFWRDLRPTGLGTVHALCPLSRCWCRCSSCKCRLANARDSLLATTIPPVFETCGLGEAQAAYRKVAAGAAGRIVLRPGIGGGSNERLSRVSSHGLGCRRGLRPRPGSVPAPPLIALVDVLGMLLGRTSVDVARYHFVRPTHCGSSEPKLLQSGKKLSRRHDVSRDLTLNARSVRLP
jgi:hypothetical protein